MEKSGIYVPLITPFTQEGEIDYAGLERATKFVLQMGADGIYAVGGSSEFPLLSTEERKRSLEVIKKAAGDAEIIAHVGATSTRESVALAKHAESIGVDMISAVAPYYFNYNFEEIKGYFYTLAECTSLPLMIYGAIQGRAYSLEETRELLSHEKIAAMKYTGFNFYQLERLVCSFPDKKFYTGADEAFLSGQVVGAYGAIGTSFNIFADKFILAKNLFAAGKNEEALRIVNAVNTFFETMFTCSSFITCTKYIMTLQGLDILPISRKPFAELDETMKKNIDVAYKKLNEDFKRSKR